MACLLLEKDSQSRKFNYVCREVLEFLELGQRPNPSLGQSDGSTQDFIDEYMLVMDSKAQRQNVILGDAFIPGDSEDIIHRSGNKRVDLQEFLTKMLKKERFFRVKTDYVAKPQPRTKDIKHDTSFSNGGILINITINNVFVFHKSLSELENFFIKLQKRIDENPIISQLIRGILSRESILNKASIDNSIVSND